MKNKPILLNCSLIILNIAILLTGCKTEEKEQIPENFVLKYKCNHGYTYCEKDFYHTNYDRVLYEIIEKNKDSLVLDIYAVGMCYDSISGNSKITDKGLELNYSFIADESVDNEECDCVFRITMITHLVPETSDYCILVNNRNLKTELSKNEFTILFKQFVNEFCNDIE